MCNQTLFGFAVIRNGKIDKLYLYKSICDLICRKEQNILFHVTWSVTQDSHNLVKYKLSIYRIYKNKCYWYNYFPRKTKHRLCIYKKNICHKIYTYIKIHDDTGNFYILRK